METKVSHSQPTVSLDLSVAKQPCAESPVTSWQLDMLAMPPELVEQYPDAVQSISELLNPDIAKFFTVPMIIGKPEATPPVVQSAPQVGSSDKPPALPPLYGNPLVMRCRSGLIASMSKITSSMLESGLSLAPDRVVTKETAPGLLLTWVYLNGFISDDLMAKLYQDGHAGALLLQHYCWGKALLAQPYHCLWVLEWCRYFAIDQADPFVTAIEQRLTNLLVQLIDQAYDHVELCNPDQLESVDIMAGWSPSQRQAIADGCKRYVDRCQVDGSRALCKIARCLWEIQQPWRPNLVPPAEIELASEYYERLNFRLADRLYRYMKIEHVLTPVETKWFQRYLNEIIKIYCPEYSGPPVSGETVLIAAMASYLCMPITFAPPDSKIEPQGRLRAHPPLDSKPEFQLPYVHMHKQELIWPKEPELLTLAAKYDLARVQSMNRPQILGYLAAIGDILPHYHDSVDNLRKLLLTRLTINYPAWRSPSSDVDIFAEAGTS